jgi:hypothetical protein
MSKRNTPNARNFEVGDLGSDSSDSINDSLNEHEIAVSNAKPGGKTTRRQQRRLIPVFLAKLFDIVSNPQLSHIVCWTKKGDNFKVLDESMFCQQILALHFKHSNMSSFVRQLNMYDFHKRQMTRNVLVFYHDFFKRDNKQLLQHIKRKTNPSYR